MRPSVVLTELLASCPLATAASAANAKESFMILSIRACNQSKLRVREDIADCESVSAKANCEGSWYDRQGSKASCEKLIAEK